MQFEIRRWRDKDEGYTFIGIDLAVLLAAARAHLEATKKGGAA